MPLWAWRGRKLTQMNANAVDPAADPYSRRLEELSKRLVGVFYEVYNELGYGFLESVYEEAYAIALAELGIRYRRQVWVPVLFRGVPAGFFKADFVVEEEVVVELKAAQAIDKAHVSQLLNYLRACELEVGYLLNFGPKAVFRRLAFSNARKNNLRSSALICGQVNPGAPDASPSS
jgi:GxxExxY protein